MSAHTKIEWCDSTINPTSGCDGCEILETCYAKPTHENRLANSFPANYAPRFLDVRMIPGRMAQAARWRDLTGTERPDKPWLNGMPRLVFISDMSDALSKAVSFEFLRDEIIALVREWKHIGLWLTKRPERMAEFDAWLCERGEDWPVNLWAGTSVTSQAKAEKRIPALLKVRAAVRFLSCEPLLGPVELDDLIVEDGRPGEWHLDCLDDDGLHVEDPDFHGAKINWVIAGGESGSGARPMHPDWPRAIRDQCMAAGVPFFFKQWGQFEPGTLITNDSHHIFPDGQIMRPVGKKAAGAVLDGLEWRAMPTGFRVATNAK